MLGNSVLRVTVVKSAAPDRVTGLLLNDLRLANRLLNRERRMLMSNSFMSPLPTFTLESLVTSGRWTAAQTNARKKAGVKTSDPKKGQQDSAPSNKAPKPTL